METRNAEHSSSDTLRQPHHGHHHHQILLPCHHQQHRQHNRLPCHHHHHHLVMLPHCCAVHGFAPPPNGPPFQRPIVPSTPETSTHLQPSFGDQENQSSHGCTGHTNLPFNGYEVMINLNDPRTSTDQDLAVFEQEDAYEELEEEEEEPIFVLTDEWRDFFAKSEAKRREATKQARKQGKK